MNTPSPYCPSGGCPHCGSRQMSEPRPGIVNLVPWVVRDCRTCSGIVPIRPQEDREQTQRVCGGAGRAVFEHEFSTRSLGGYGLYSATVKTADGRETTGLGLTEKQAYLNALRATERIGR